MRTAPTRVSQDELDRVERVGGEGSHVYQRLAEQRAVYVAWEPERDCEEARIRAEREATFAAEVQARADAQEARRKEEDAALVGRLRANFFAANSAATEADYTKAADRLKEEHFVRESRRDVVGEQVSALTRSAPSGFRGTF